MPKFRVGQGVSTSSGGVGVIVDVTHSLPEPGYRVFLNGRSEPFYEGQLTAAELDTSAALVDADAFRCKLAALTLMSPSGDSALSFNEGRIDHIPYQYRPVLRLLRADRPRLLIADEVGVGKTIEAGLVLRELHARRELRRVLIVCSKALIVEEKWQSEMRRFDEEFTPLDGAALRHCLKQTDLDGEWPERYARAILPFSLFNEELLLGDDTGPRRLKGLLELSPPPAFDLIIVDEAHNARNPESWLHRGLRVLCGESESVLFLTATPIQLGSHELFHLLNLLRPDVVIDRPTFERMAEPNPYINSAITAARRAAPGWTASGTESLQRAARTPWGQSMLASNPGFESVLTQLQGEPGESDRVALIRQMEGLHTFAHIINRTRRRDIGNFTVRQPRTEPIEFTAEQQELHDEVLRLQERLLRLRHGDIPTAFLMSMIRRQLASCVHGLAPLLEEIMQRGLAALESADTEAPDSARDLLDSIRAEIARLARMARELPPEDPKVDRLLNIARGKVTMPNHRLLLFSTFRHTLAYLERKLVGAGIRAGLVHGGIDNDERRALRRRFALPKADSEAIDVLLSSEIGSEGLDFQFCDAIVNYDIPWNPMRIEQRIGRIDRYGQKSETVAIWNLVTPGTVDFEVYERCLLRIGVFAQSIGGCEEILGEIAREIRSVAEDMTLSPAERQARLQQLAENDIRLLHEQDELEKRQTELFGIRPVTRGGEDDISEAIWLAPPALERLVHAYLMRLFPERESLLGAGPLKTLRLAGDARRVLLSRSGPKRALVSLTDRQWLAWLKGGEPTVPVTFDRDTARENPAAILITPVHPLVRLAADAYGGDNPLNVSLSVSSASVAPGRYPFAVYQWRLTGIKPDAKLVAVTPCPADQLSFFSMIAGASDKAADRATGFQTSDLDALHHRLWSEAREKHRDDTAATATFRSESFLASHRARMETLRELEGAASDARIRKMRAAQIAAAETEAEHRFAELAKAKSEADILFRPVAYGTLEVETA
jgi:superfamily II DNA or RNA helicase